jgi:hypothetical protein
VPRQGGPRLQWRRDECEEEIESTCLTNTRMDEKMPARSERSGPT